MRILNINFSISLKQNMCVFVLWVININVAKKYIDFEHKVFLIIESKCVDFKANLSRYVAQV